MRNHFVRWTNPHLALLRDKRGAVALLAALSMPALLMSLALGIEASSWSVGKLSLQRVADVAALAGAVQYAGGANARTATGYAATLAEINGIPGSTRNWDGDAATMTETLIVAKLVTGIRSASNKAIQVTVKRIVPRTFSRIVNSTQPSVTISAVAVAEVGSLGAQPCITALGGGVDGITTGTDVSVGGSASLIATGCSLRANDDISQNGGGSISAAGIYAGGNIPTSGVCCDLHPHAGQIPDPYAANTSLQHALTLLSSGAGSAVTVQSGNYPLAPGTYSNWDVKGGTLSLSPGLYVVNGNISTSAQAGITGKGVTVVMSGSVNMTGGSSLVLEAPTTSPTGNAVPGVLFAGNSNSSMSFLGNSTSPVTGLVYFPKASLKFGGTSAGGSSGCTEVIASTVTLVGTTSVAANCAAYGLVNFSSLPGSAPVTLVQ
jgi:Flp pilus assembly protein TadG